MRGNSDIKSRVCAVAASGVDAMISALSDKKRMKRRGTAMSAFKVAHGEDV